MSAIRHGLREEQFRRYEPVIQSAVTQWPHPTEVKTFGRVTSLETLRARLRDAMLSLKLHKWKTQINLERFLEVEQQSIVTIEKDSVWIKPRGCNLETTQAEILTGLNILTEEPAVVMSLLTLHHHQTLTLPSRLTTQLNPEDFSKGLDISIAKQTSNSYLIF